MPEQDHAPDSSERPSGRVAFFGLGRMGVPMAARLVQAGFEVRIFDPSEAARGRAAEVGCVVTDGVAAAMEEAATVITMLPDERAVEGLAEGEGGLLREWPADALWIEMTSSMPAVTRRIAAAVGRLGGRFVDAPVSGGVRGAEAGTLTVMAAGESGALAAAEPFLEPISARVVFAGEQPGAGDCVKSLNNMLSAINLTAASEAIAIALREGVDPGLLVDAVGTSTGASNAMEVKVGKFALENRYDSGFTIDQYLKDLRIALTMAEADELSPALAGATREIWQRLADEEADGGSLDHTAVVPLLLGRSGLELPGR